MKNNKQTTIKSFINSNKIDKDKSKIISYLKQIESLQQKLRPIGITVSVQVCANGNLGKGWINQSG